MATLSKKNVLGYVLTLLFVLALNETRIFNFFINDYVGRTLFLIIIIYCSYINKILGLIILLFLINAFNSNEFNVESYNYNFSSKFKSNFAFFEGFQGIDNKSTSIEEKKTQIKDTNNANSNIKKPVKQSIQDKLLLSSSEASTHNADETSAIEGFCFSDKETSILRGKQSNSIKISKNENFNFDEDKIIPSSPNDLMSSWSLF